VARRPFMVDGNEISLTVSIGVAESRGRSPLIVLREAERALTAAKQEKNQVCFYCETNAKQTPAPELRRRPLPIL
jgi:GGDEF domain-containing protein